MLTIANQAQYYLKLFGLISLISFVGSLQVGLVNSRVLFIGIHSGRTKATHAAIGGSIPEFFYAFLAGYAVYFAAGLINQYQTSIGLITGLVLIIAGAYMYLSPDSGSDLTLQTSDNTVGRYPFFQGLALGSANPQLIVFWSGIATQQQIPPSETMFIWLCIYGLGAMFGALVLLLTIAWFSPTIQRKVNRKTLSIVSKTIALALVVGGLFVVGKTVIRA